VARSRPPRVGGWPAGLAIPFVADGTSALLITAASTVSLLCLVVAAARGEDAHPLFHPLVAVLLAGVLGSFVTGDLFNLFVTFEVMLIASYVLVALRGGRREVRAGAVYVTVNLLASALLLIGIGLLYGAAGRWRWRPAPGRGRGPERPHRGVDGRRRHRREGQPRPGPQLAAPRLPRGGTGRHRAVLGPPDQGRRLRPVPALGDGLRRRGGLPRGAAVVAVVTMVVGVLGAVGSADVRGILSFHMVSQVGYLVLPLGIGTVAGFTAGLVYLLQYLAVKGALFLSAAAIETFAGTGRLAHLGGMLRTRPPSPSGSCCRP
jgi:multicomponent Na+:H+ antiporter subunit D